MTTDSLHTAISPFRVTQSHFCLGKPIPDCAPASRRFRRQCILSAVLLDLDKKKKGPEQTENQQRLPHPVPSHQKSQFSREHGPMTSKHTVAGRSTRKSWNIEGRSLEPLNCIETRHPQDNTVFRARHEFFCPDKEFHPMSQWTPTSRCHAEKLSAAISLRHPPENVGSQADAWPC